MEDSKEALKIFITQFLYDSLKFISIDLNTSCVKFEFTREVYKVIFVVKLNIVLNAILVNRESRIRSSSLLEKAESFNFTDIN